MSDETTIWQSAIIPDLMLTDDMLKLLQSRYPSITKWQPFMLDLEEYLISNPDKHPVNFTRWILKCAKRRADDVAKGFRRPDGTVNFEKWNKHKEQAYTAPPDRTDRIGTTVSLGEILSRAQEIKP